MRHLYINHCACQAAIKLSQDFFKYLSEQKENLTCCDNSYKVKIIDFMCEKNDYHSKMNMFCKDRNKSTANKDILLHSRDISETVQDNFNQ